MFDNKILNVLNKVPIIAVLVVDDPNDVDPIAEALIEGGIVAIELALRTPSSLDSLKKFRKYHSQLLVGAGTVLTEDQLKQVMDTGATFAVSPGTNPKVLQQASNLNFSFAPGITTPTDIECALEYDCNILKFFPAELIGGLRYLDSISNPYKHLGIKYIPLGGLNYNNFKSYILNENIVAVGGSWIAQHSLIANKNWEKIKKNALDALSLIDNMKNNTKELFYA